METNNQPISEEVRELLWRRALSDAETARAATTPASRAELALEARLTAALDQLPVLPTPSNFTARVLQAVDLAEAQTARAGWTWTQWLPRLASVVTVFAVTALVWHSHELHQRRLAIAQSVALVAGSPALPDVEALNNFDAIQRMGQTQAADEKLLALLQ